MKDETSKNERPDAKENGAEEEVSFFHKMRSDVFRRKVEGVLKEGVFKNFMSEMKLPREIVTHIFSQIDETKQATLKVVAKEIREFLENTNLSDELAKLLTQLSFEVSTKVRFVRNEPAPREDKKHRKPKKISTKVAITRNASDSPPPTDEASDKGNEDT